MNAVTQIGLTPEQHEERIDLLQRQMLSAKSPEVTRMWGGAFLMAVLQRNAERSKELVEQIERERGLR